MEETKDRLVKCFEIVFPELTKQTVTSASQETVATWDSVAAITLVNVIEEEFQFQMDFDLLPELNSFGSILAYVEAQLGNSLRESH
jgi:acyl carrier protein